MEVRELVTRLGFAYNGAGVTQYEGAVGRIKSLGAGLGTFLKTALAGVTVYAMGRAIKSTLEFGDELLNSSKITGIAVESLNNLRNAYKLANVDQGTLTSSLVIFSSKLAKAQTGKGAEFDAFKALGIDPTKIKSTEEGFGLVTDSLSKLEDGFGKTSKARELFGRGGAALIPGFGAEKTEEFLKYSKVIDAFGKGPNKTFAEQSDHINDSLDVFGLAMQRLKITIVTAMYPAITSMIDGMVDWISANKDWLSSGIETSLKAVGVVFTIIGRALTLIKDAIKFIMATPWLRDFIALGVVFNLLLSPLTWIYLGLLAIFLIIDDIAAYFKGGDSFTGDAVMNVKDAIATMLLLWTYFKDEVVKAFQAISDGVISIMSSMFDWMLLKIENITKMLAGIFGEKALGLVLKVGGGGLNLDDLKNASKFGNSPTQNTTTVPSGAVTTSNVKTVAPVFNSSATISVTVTNEGEGFGAEGVAEKVKQVAQKVMREEYRTAFLNLQGIENRGLA